MKKIKISQVNRSPGNMIFLVVSSIAIGTTIGLLIGSPNFRLVGASVSDNGRKLAILENTITKQQVVVEPQEFAFDDVRVLKIENGEVELEIEGKTVVLNQKAISAPQQPENAEERDPIVNELLEQLTQGVNNDEITIDGMHLEEVELESLRLPEMSEAERERIPPMPDESVAKVME